MVEQQTTDHESVDAQPNDNAARGRSETIVHLAAAAAAGASAMAVIPGSDAVAIMPIQIMMVAAVANEYGIKPSGSLIKSTIYASLGSIVGKGGSRLLTRWTPIAGNVVRAGVAFGVTEGLGRMAIERLQAGESLV